MRRVNPPKPITYTPGHWPISELRQAQCRFICTPHDGPRDGHLCCGEPTTIGRGNPHGSWCDAHRAVVFRAGSVEGDGAEVEGIAA